MYRLFFFSPIRLGSSKCSVLVFFPHFTSSVDVEVRPRLNHFSSVFIHIIAARERILYKLHCESECVWSWDAWRTLCAEQQQRRRRRRPKWTVVTKTILTVRVLEEHHSVSTPIYSNWIRFNFSRRKVYVSVSQFSTKIYVRETFWEPCRMVYFSQSHSHSQQCTFVCDALVFAHETEVWLNWDQVPLLRAHTELHQWATYNSYY